MKFTDKTATAEDDKDRELLSKLALLLRLSQAEFSYDKDEGVLTVLPS